MARKSRRSPEGGSDQSPEEYIAYRQRETEPSPDATSSPETRATSASVDTAAIETARARALAVRTTETEQEEKKEENVVLRFGRVTMGVGKGSVQVAVGSVAALGFLGYKTARPFARGMLLGIDWLAHKMDKVADKMIDKNLFLLNYLVNPLVSLLDWTAKSLKLDKTLAAHLKKNEEDRKKLAEKAFKEFKESEKKQEKKEDDAKKKSKRREKLVEVLGQDAADALEGELAELDKKDESTSAEVPKPAEAVKAA